MAVIIIRVQMEEWQVARRIIMHNKHRMRTNGNDPFQDPGRPSYEESYARVPIIDTFEVFTREGFNDPFVARADKRLFSTARIDQDMTAPKLPLELLTELSVSPEIAMCRFLPILPKFVEEYPDEMPVGFCCLLFLF